MVSDEVEVRVTVEVKAKLEGTWNSKDFPTKKANKKELETNQAND